MRYLKRGGAASSAQSGGGCARGGCGTSVRLRGRRCGCVSAASSRVGSGQVGSGRVGRRRWGCTRTAGSPFAGGGGGEGWECSCVCVRVQSLRLQSTPPLPGWTNRNDSDMDGSPLLPGIRSSLTAELRKGQLVLLSLGRSAISSLGNH